MRQSKSLDDLAAELGLSKSTVSRALSGKGRISAETRSRVMDYAQKNAFVPNGIASSLASNRTNNIAVVIPSEAFSNEVPFFQQCLMGVCEAASGRQYDVLVVAVAENDITRLQRIIALGKMDGALLTRSLAVDYPADCLKRAGLPFVTIGSSDDAEIFQIDTDTVGACQELTAELLQRGKRRIALLLGNIEYIVNRNRLKGYTAAFQAAGLSPDAAQIYTGIAGGKAVKEAAQKAAEAGADAIVCGDDFICQRAIEQLYSDGSEVEVASFYNSDSLRKLPLLTAVIDVDVRSYGMTAGNALLDLLETGEIERKRYIPHRILHF